MKTEHFSVFAVHLRRVAFSKVNGCAGLDSFINVAPWAFIAMLRSLTYEKACYPSG